MAEQNVCVVGVSCRFPGAESIEEFWSNLLRGVQTPGCPQNSSSRSRSYGFLKDPNRFDAELFDISPNEAAHLDPQHRFVLEMVWTALEQANIPCSSLRNSDTSVFVGLSNNDSRLLAAEGSSNPSSYLGIGTSPGFCSGRISHFFGFRGESITIDTTSSSSLAAIHYASNCVSSGRSQIAIAAGVNFLSTSRAIELLDITAPALSPNHISRSFDFRSDGIGRCEGCAVIVLASQKYAKGLLRGTVPIISGSSCGHNGRSSTITAPNGLAQESLFKGALSAAGLSPDDIQYIEGHATGNVIGDPIEMKAISNVYCHNERRSPLVVGSVKTNFGHAEAASGLAGLIKVVLALKGGKIPPHLHLESMHPHLVEFSSSILVPSTEMEWRRPSGSFRAAGVSSFGMSGTNAHVIVSEIDLGDDERDTSSPIAPKSTSLFCLSGQSRSSIRLLARRYLEMFHGLEMRGQFISLEDVCWSSFVCRSTLRYRATFVVESIPHLRHQLENLEDFLMREGLQEKSVEFSDIVAFAFSGQEKIGVGLGSHLYQCFPRFREAFDLCDGLIKQFLGDGFSISKILWGGSENLLSQTIYKQLGLFAFEYSLASLWESIGVKAKLVMGHSLGECVAACFAGVFGLKDAINFVVKRASLMESLSRGAGRKGQMVAVVGVPSVILRELECCLDENALGGLNVAAVNGSCQVVLSGLSDAIESSIFILKKIRGVRCFLLDAPNGFHSFLMDPILEELCEFVDLHIPLSIPDIPFVSNVLGRVLSSPDELRVLCSGRYWATHVRTTVRFFQGMRSVHDHGISAAVEMGSRGVLTKLAKKENLFPCFSGFFQQGTDSREERSSFLRSASQFSFSLPPRILTPGEVVHLPRYCLKRQIVGQEEPPDQRSPQSCEARDRETLSNTIRQILSVVTGKPCRSVDSFMELGLDSLMVVEVSHKLSAALSLEISPIAVYDYPTVSLLADHFHSFREAKPPLLFSKPESPLLPESTSEITILGMACVFPGGDNLVDFWKCFSGLGNREDLLHSNRDELCASLNSQSKVGRYAFLLSDIESFDNLLFDIPKYEAPFIDPQQRILLETTWKAFENAGIPSNALQGSDTGVFVGVFQEDFSGIPQKEKKSSLGPGSWSSLLSGRVSHFFGFNGPSITYNTACSSSLVAVHEAARAIRCGECSLAVVAGVNVILSGDSHHKLMNLGALSPSGFCHTFDAIADGYARGEGCGVIILKKKELHESGIGSLLGSAVNHGGRASSLTAPRGPAQEDVIRKALQDANLESGEVQVVEAHGTGTQLGDPIEMKALMSVFGGQTRKDPLVVTSLKRCVGHAEGAAGVFGLIKLVLCLQFGEIPTHGGLHVLNPHMCDLPRFPAVIPSTTMAWRQGRTGKRRIGGVSSFGISGTNSHAIIGEPLQTNPVLSRMSSPLGSLFCISAKNQESLFSLANSYLSMLDGLMTRGVRLSIDDLCSATHFSRNHLSCRFAGAVESVDGLVHQLKEFVAVPEGLGDVPSQIAFAFCGDGQQFFELGGRILSEGPKRLREILMKCDCLVKGLSGGISLLSALQNGSNPQLALVVELSTFEVEYCLAAYFMSFGVVPSLLIGDSIGEIVAACISGVISLSDSVKLILKKRQLQDVLQKHSPAASIISVVGSSPAEVMRVIEDCLPSTSLSEITVTGVNPSQVILYGLSRVLQLLIPVAKSRNWIVAQSNSSHFPIFDPMSGEFEEFVKGISLSPPKFSLASTLEGRIFAPLDENPFGSPCYWSKRIHSTVRFLPVVKNLFKGTFSTVIEFGPAEILKSTFKSRGGFHFHSIQPETQSLLQHLASILGSLYECNNLVPSPDDLKSPLSGSFLPSYQFCRLKFQLGPSPKIESSFLHSSSTLVPWENLPKAEGESSGVTVLQLGNNERVSQIFGSYVIQVIHIPHQLHLFHVLDSVVVKSSHIVILFDDGVCQGPQHWVTLVLGVIQRFLRSESLPQVTLVVESEKNCGRYLSPETAALAGLVRSIRCEAPQLGCRLLCVSPGWQNLPLRERVICEAVGGATDHGVAVLQTEGRFIFQLAPCDSLQKVKQREIIRKGGVYLVTGGLGGIGRVVCEWLAGNGAGHIIIFSRRSSLTKECQVYLESLSSKSSSQVHVFSVDIASSEVKILVSVIERRLGEIRGVMHLAGVLSDGILVQQTKEKFDTVFGPKVGGAHALHFATLHHRLDWFVLASSIAVFGPWKGQSNYAAANGYLDGFANYRREIGLSGLSIQWGIWEGVGMSGTEKVQAVMKRRKGKFSRSGLSGNDGSQALETLLQTNARVVAVTVNYWSDPAAKGLDLFFSKLKRTNTPEREALPVHSIDSEPKTKLREVLTSKEALEEIKLVVCDELQVDINEVKDDSSFGSLGVDSLLGLEISEKLGELFGAQLSPTAVIDYPTPSRLSKYILELLSKANNDGDEDDQGRSQGDNGAQEDEEESSVWIIGADCKFPNGQGLSDLWRHLLSGNSHETQIKESKVRAGMDGMYGNILDDVDKFDNNLFDIRDSEAQAMDPQHRLLLEVTWGAIESTNMAQDKFRSTKTGVFVGAGNSEYGSLSDQTSSFTIAGTTPSVAAGRISHFFGLQGPSMVTDTACSSSLVAMHLAVSSLRKGECDYAIVGGVNMMLSPNSTKLLQHTNALSPDGVCHTFDFAANGYARAEGCGVVILSRKIVPEQRAMAKVLGSSMNHDGRATSLTAPNGPAQEEVLRGALTNAGIKPEDVQVLEAHGTGTQLGDPIEMRALRSVYGGKTRTTPLVIGSVKTNVGHTEIAAGIAGLLKLILSLNHGIQPPHLHFQASNPHMVDFGTFPCVIPIEPMEWKRPKGACARIGAVSSFGFSGTNVHLIISEASMLDCTPTVTPREGQQTPVFCISAASQKSVLGLGRKYAKMMIGLKERGGIIDIEKICLNARVCRDSLGVCLAIPALSLDQLVNELSQESQQHKELFVSKAKGCGQGVVMAFSGQGGWSDGTEERLYNCYTAFREAHDQCTQWILSAKVPRCEQLKTFALEYALAHLWMSFGVRPSLVIGHSIGEYIAACISGAWCLKDALKVVAKRSQLMGDIERHEKDASLKGGMVAIQMEVTKMMKVLEIEMDSEALKDIDVAGVNGFRQTVLSGKQRALQRAISVIQKWAPSTKCRSLKVTGGFHSHLMKPAVEELKVFIESEEVQVHEPSIPFMSSVTGRLVEFSEGEQTEFCTGEYWSNHLQSTVRFLQSAQKITATKNIRAVIECGPGAVLCNLFQEISLASENSMIFVPSVNGKGKGLHCDNCFERGFACLVASGLVESHSSPNQRGVGVSNLPGYSFDQRSYWARRNPSALLNSPAPEILSVSWITANDPPLNPQTPSGVGFFQVVPNQDFSFKSFMVSSFPSLRVIEGSTLFDPLVLKAGLLWESTFEEFLGQLSGVSKIVLFFRECHQLGQKNLFVCFLVALVKKLIGRSMQLTVIVESKRKVLGHLSPETAALAGLVRSIRCEAPQLGCRLLCVSPGWQNLPLRERVICEAVGGATDHGVAVLQTEGRFIFQLAPCDSLQKVKQREIIRKGGVYLVTGGLGGIGRVVCEWLAGNGAGHIIIFSRRSSLTKECQVYLESLSSKSSSQVHVFSVDIASSEVKILVSVIERRLGEIRGVMHLAGVLSDGILVQQTKEKFDTVFGPKVGGAHALHFATLHHRLDWFVLASSIAVFGPWKGQSNYAAANGYLDGFANYRREIGLSGLSIQWGIWEGVGMSGTEKVQAVMKRRKGKFSRSGLSGNDGSQALETLLQTNARVVAVTVNYWSDPAAKGLDLFFSKLKRTNTPEREALPVHSIDSEPKTKLREVLTSKEALEEIKLVVCDELQVDINEVKDDSSFGSLGVDSLLGLEISEKLGELFGAQLSPTAVIDYPTPSRLSKYILELLSKANNDGDEDDQGRSQGDNGAQEDEEESSVWIIGADCKFPNGQGLSDLWRHLLSGNSHETQIKESKVRAGMDGMYGNILDDVDKFDNNLFDIRDSEAQAMDPQHRLLLEVTWGAIESTNMAQDKFRSTKTGVFVGAGNSEYGSLSDQTSSFTIAGTTPSVAAGRISHFFGLQGPSMVTDTACSSSLVAMHLAVSSLRKGECDYAIVGGVNMMLSPNSTKLLQHTNALSPDGVCHTFDFAANGYARAEGCGVVILSRKIVPEQRAMAKVLGSSMNHDGRATSLTAPNGPAQEEVLRGALTNAGIKPEDVQVLEAHGTGTQLGDPIEMRALRSVYGGKTRTTPLVIGSVKTNVGHTEIAAGIAGLLKLILSLNHGIQPPHLHFQASNPHMVDFGTFPCVIPIEPMEWKRPKGACARIGAVSSFGFSGTNVHLIISEASMLDCTPTVTPQEGQQTPVFCISAASQKSVLGLGRKYAKMMIGLKERGGIIDIEKICLNARVCRDSLGVCLAIPALSLDQLVNELSQESQQHKELFVSKAKGCGQGVVMAFSGQGGWSDGTEERLYNCYTAFREAHDQCTQWILSAKVPRCEQLKTFALEYALAHLWMSFGVRPSLVIGHSIGEYIAACISGAWCLKDALKVVAKRSQLMGDIERHEKDASLKGGMVAIQMEVTKMMKVLEIEMDSKALKDIDVAGVNGFRQTVLSGKQRALQRAISVIQKWAPSTKCRSLKVTGGFHSHLMKPAVEELKVFIESEEVQVHEPSIPFMSSVTGRLVEFSEGEQTEFCTGEYWSNHLQSTVRFLQSAQKITATKNIRAVIECGPGAVLCNLFREISLASENSMIFVPSVNGKGKGLHCDNCFERGFACLVASGLVESHSSPNQSGVGVSNLPGYSFDQRSHWLFPALQETKRAWDTKERELVLNLEVKAKMIDLLCEKLQVHRDRVEGCSSFASLGVDSLMGLEISRKLCGLFGICLSPRAIIDYPTPLEFSKYISHVISVPCVKQEQSLTKQEALEEIKLVVRDELQVDINEVKDDSSFGSLGVDSLLGLEISEKLGELFGAQLSPTAVIDYPTPSRLSKYILELLSKANNDGDEDDQGRSQGDNGAQEDEEESSVWIIGADCKFPNGQGLSDLWRHLLSGNSHETQIKESKVRAGMDGMYGNILDDVDKFDNNLFDIRDSEAQAMDPQHRLLLEVTWGAIESTNMAQDKFRSTKTGVFVGAGNSEYGSLSDQTSSFTIAGTTPSVAAGRISHFFGLQGPSMVTDTACSSSLVAMHLAVSSLRKGECDYAIVGGVNMMLSPNSTKLLQHTNALSPDGVCHTFDFAANGYARAEGCGVVILSRKIAPEQRAMAKVLGSSMNHDGRATSLTAPNGPAQEEVLRGALTNAGIKPEDVQVLEAHGTGTQLGDPIEMRALRSVYGGKTRTTPLVIGSVKTNVGHTEIAAGIAGLLKLILSLNHGIQPPHLHFQASNPHMVDFGTFPCVIPIEPMEWKRPKGACARIGAVSSFGFSGTNVHLIISEASMLDCTPTVTPREGQQTPVFCISAASQKSVLGLGRKYAKMMIGLKERGGIIDIEKICLNARACRDSLGVCLAIPALSLDQLVNELSQESQQHKELFVSKAKGCGQGVVMAFSGQGGWSDGTEERLYNCYTAFREAHDQCTQWILSAKVPRCEQLKTFALEYALAHLWMSFGVRPSLVIGHSIGEYIAACISGAWCLKDALKVVAKRSQLMGDIERHEKDASLKGGMVAIQMEVTKMMKVLEIEMDSKALKDIDVAGVNGFRQTVLSGKQRALQRAISVIQKWAPSTKCRSLKVTGGFHSHLMKPAVEELKVFIESEEVQVHEPSIPFMSSVTGRLVEFSEGEQTEFCTGEYWSYHLRSTVRFLQSAQKITATKNIRAVIECGPGAVLCNLFQEISLASENSMIFVPSVNGKGKGLHCDNCFERGFACLVASGLVESHSSPNQRGVGVSNLPGYSFDQSSYWLSQTRDQLQPIRADQSSPRFARVLEMVKQILEEELGGTITSDSSFASLGVDSLLSVHLIEKFAQLVGLKLCPSAIAEFPIVSAFAAHVTKLLEGDQPELNAAMKIKQIIHKELHVDLEDLEENSSFEGLGVDSLLGVVIKEKVGKYFGVSLSPALALEQTIGDLSRHICGLQSPPLSSSIPLSFAHENEHVVAPSHGIEFRFLLPGGRSVAAVHYGPENATHCLLAVHGWLDNSSSFTPLATLIESSSLPVRLVCIDLPGHGKSNHFDELYSLDAFVDCVRVVADSLSWATFHLIGHCLGASVVSLFASIYHERVSSLTLLDFAGFQSSVFTNKDFGLYSHYRYGSLAESVSAALRRNPLTSRASFTLLAKRGLKNNEGGWIPTWDSKLIRHCSSLLISKTTSQVMKGVTAKTICIFSSKPHYVLGERLCFEPCEDFCTAQHTFEHEGHYFHMENPNLVLNSLMAQVNLQ